MLFADLLQYIYCHRNPGLYQYELTYEIMAPIALRKLNLQTCMRGNPLRLHVWFLVRPFVYFHTLCVWTAMALARPRGCAVSPEPSLFAYVISTIISWAGSYEQYFELRRSWDLRFPMNGNSENCDFDSFIGFISSPEPSGSQGELIVCPYSGVRCRCRRRQQCLNIFSS